MRTLALLLLAGSTLAADVLVLKGGGRVSGKVVDKATHYEVTAEGVLRTYLKEEVEKVVASPKEFLGDSDQLYEEAKADFQKAVALASPAEQQPLVKEAIAKVTRAREAYASTLDLFPEDDALGKKLMQIMQLMRLLRDRLGSEIAKRPATGGTPSSAPPPATLLVDDALAVLLDPSKRADAGRRGSALSSFKNQRTSYADNYDLATAAMMFLARSDAEMKLEGPALKAVQEYFEKPWLKEPQKLTPALHQAAAQYLAERLPALRSKPDTAPAAEALYPFAVAHLSSAPAGPDVEKSARAVGLVVQNGLVGTPEGHAVRDLAGWISNGDFDLAVLAFIKEYRSIDTPAVRFVWSYALLRQVQARKRGFERPIGAFETVKLPAPGPDHIAALVKSIRAAAVDNVCGGEGRVRCTNCHGRKEIKYVCAKCKGKGRTISSLGAELLCLPCKGSGTSTILKCEKCKDGYFDCKQCEKARAAPELDEILSSSPCAACEGRGLAFRKAGLPCKACLGLGQKLVPKADPSKLLP